MAVGVVAIEFMGVKKVMGVVVAVEAPREKSSFFFINHVLFRASTRAENIP